ncbi:hypothetical protein ACFX2C_003603 [Malus domestica]
MISVIVWLFNPFTFTIGTRGNCEPIVCALVLWVFICLMNGRELQAAFWYGLVVHFRIYPIIHALPILMILDPHVFRHGQKPRLQYWNRRQDSPQSSSVTRLTQLLCPWFLLKSALTRERILFSFISAAVFFLFTGLFYHLYGWDFLYEALLYHLTRTDPRHNFSVYFYHIYLQYHPKLKTFDIGETRLIFASVDSPDSGIRGIQQGDDCTILCVVLLSLAAGSRLEQHEA